MICPMYVFFRTLFPELVPRALYLAMSAILQPPPLYLVFFNNLGGIITATSSCRIRETLSDLDANAPWLPVFEKLHNVCYEK